MTVPNTSLSDDYSSVLVIETNGQRLQKNLWMTRNLQNHSAELWFYMTPAGLFVSQAARIISYLYELC